LFELFSAFEVLSFEQLVKMKRVKNMYVNFLIVGPPAITGKGLAMRSAGLNTTTLSAYRYVC
jgi:hypothetical protein